MHPHVHVVAEGSPDTGNGTISGRSFIRMQNFIKLGALKMLRVGQLRASHGHHETCCLPAHARLTWSETPAARDTRATLLRVPGKQVPMLNSQTQIPGPFKISPNVCLVTIQRQQPFKSAVSYKIQASTLIREGGCTAFTARMAAVS